MSRARGLGPRRLRTKLATALLTRGGPDVFEGQLTAAMVTAGQVAPLDDLFPPDVRADFNPTDLAMNTVNGKVYGVKMLDDTGVLYYRKSLLRSRRTRAARDDGRADRRGKEAVDRRPQGPVRRQRRRGQRALINILPWSAGGDFLVDNQIDVQQPPHRRRLRKAARAERRRARLLIGAPTDWWDPSAFTQGLAAMQWTGLWAYPAIRKALGDDVGGLPWPALDAGGSPRRSWAAGRRWSTPRATQIEEAKKLREVAVDRQQARPSRTGACPTASMCRRGPASPGPPPPCARPCPPRPSRT